MAEEQRSLIIKGLCPGLVERGKIKIGMKGDERKTKAGGTFQLPKKLDHFIVTGMCKSADGNFARDEEIHGVIGEKPTRIPIRLLYNDIELNFQCRYAAYNGKSLQCSGDGQFGRWHKEDGQFEKVNCTCQYYGNNDKKVKLKCKINATLSVLIDSANAVGGVWKFRTTSYNSTVGILSSLTLIKRLSGGVLAGVPLEMTLNPKTVTNPETGNLQVVYVVAIEYRGTAQQLQKTGLNIALTDAKHSYRIENIESEARKLITSEKVDADFSDTDDVVDEFYPEQAQQAAIEKPKQPEQAAIEKPKQPEQAADKPQEKPKHKGLKKAKPPEPPVDTTPDLAVPDGAEQPKEVVNTETGEITEEPVQAAEDPGPSDDDIF